MEQKKIRLHFSKHVYITVEEGRKLLVLMSEEEVRYWVKRLDSYLDRHTSKHYASHYLTILNWWRRENKSPTYQKEFATPKEIY